MKRIALAMIGVGAGAVVSAARADINYTTLAGPSGSIATYATGVSGSTVAGYYEDKSKKYHGFTLSGSKYTTFNDPNGTGSQGTQPAAISGSTVTGIYQDSTGLVHGFTYDGSIYTTVDDTTAGAYYTLPYGISGNTVVGFYQASVNGAAQTHGFTYDQSSKAFTTFDDPAAVGYSQNRGVDGGNLIGIYADANGNEHSFLFNGSAFSSFDEPNQVPGDYTTIASGISGNNIVGYYQGFQPGSGGSVTAPQLQTSYGFLFDGTNFTTLADPSADPTLQGTQAIGISGNVIVGNYEDSSGVFHAFEATVPEPGSVFLLTCSTASFLSRRRRRES